MESVTKYFNEMKKTVKVKGFKNYQEWFDKMFAIHKDDLDLHILYLDVLYFSNHDQLYEKEETKFLIKASEILKNSKSNLILKAKAYAYIGYFKYYAVDRISYCDKSIDILNKIGGNTSEMKELRDFCEEVKNSGSRKIMFYLNEDGSMRTEL